uniref:Post-GPI attachment to proteins 2 n=1 Tax=Salarias fasciatus TaxID=181472 RepID=A0A672GMM1_SALFA
IEIFPLPLVVRVSFSACVLGTVCLPLLGLIICVFISSVFHFEDATGTHCQWFTMGEN